MQNTGWLVGDKVLRLGVSLIVGVWIARYLGPGNFGLLSYCAAFVSLFAWLSDLGLDRIVVRELVTGTRERSRVLGTAFLLKLGGGFLILGMSTLLATVLNPVDKRVVILIAITAAGGIAQAADVIDYDFQALIQSKYVTLARSLAFQILSIIKLLLIFWQAPLIAFAVAGSVETVLAGTLLFVVHRRKAGVLRWQWDYGVAKALVAESWPLMFSSLMIVVYMRIDQVMLKSLSNIQEIGKYAAAVRLSEGWYFVLMAMSTSMFPKLVNAHAISEDRLNATIRRCYSAIILVSYGFALPLSLLSHTVSSALFGSEFNGMETMLTIGAWAGVFVGIGLVRGAYCTTKGLNRFLLYSTTVGACLNIVLNILLMPRFGGRGAALATLTSYAVAGYGTTFFYAPVRQQGRIISEMLLPWNAWRYLNWREVLVSFRCLHG